MLAVGRTAQHQAVADEESGGVSCNSAETAGSVTARQLIEAIQRGGGGLFAGGGGLLVDLGLLVEAVGAGQPHLGVVTREVVDAADWWQAAEGGVGTVMVVPVDPGLQGPVAGGI